MQFQALIDELSDICTKVNDNPDSPIQQLDHEKVWTTLFNIASNDMRNTSLLYPMINVYSTRFPSFREENKVIEKYVNDFIDNTKTENERKLNSVSIFRWLPYLPSKLVPKIINSAIDLTDKYINDNNDIPFDFLLPLNDGEISDMEESTLDDLFAKLQTDISEGESKQAASLCVYSTMCHSILDLKPEASDFNNDMAFKFLQSQNEKDQLSGCYFLIFLSECFADPEIQNASVPPPAELFNLLKPLVIHKTNEHIRKRANKAFIKLIQTKYFLDGDIVKQFLSLFDDFAADQTNLLQFYKILSNFILPRDSKDDEKEEEEDVIDLDIAQPIIDFISEKLADKSNHMVQGLSLDSLSDVGFQQGILIEDLVPTGLDVSKSLISEKEIATYPFIANFLTILKEKFHDQTVEQIKPLVPTIVAELNSEKLGTVKQRIYCAGAISQLIHDGIATEETQNVVQFVLNNLNCGEEKSLFNLCSVILPIVKQIGEDNANTIFNSFVENVKKTENEEYLNAWMVVLSKLIKHYTLNEDSVTSIVALIMSGELKIFHGVQPHLTMPPIITPFILLSSYVKKYPTKGEPICSTLVDWLKFTPFTSMMPILIPLQAGIEVHCMDEQLAKTLADILKSILLKIDIFDYEPLACISDAFGAMYKSYRELLTPIIDYLTPLEKFTKECYIEGMEEDQVDLVQEELLESMANVGGFVFEVYSNDDEVKVLPGVINPILSLMPFSPEVETVPEMLDNICTMLENKDRFDEIAVNALKMMADVLLMKKADLNEFNFEDDLIKRMKQTLKTYCKGNKRMINAVTSDFRSSRAKINRFNVLIK